MYLALRVHLSITRFTTSLSREWCASRATSCVDALLRAALASSITLSFAPIIHHHLLTSLCYLLNTCSAVVLTPPSPGLPSHFASIEPRSRLSHHRRRRFFTFIVLICVAIAITADAVWHSSYVSISIESPPHRPMLSSRNTYTSACIGLTVASTRAASAG